MVDNSGNPAGCGIVRVTAGGAAQKAGLASGDIITAVSGTPTPLPAALAQVLAKLDPGQKVSVTARQPNGSSKTFSLTLGQLPG